MSRRAQQRKAQSKQRQKKKRAAAKTRRQERAAREAVHRSTERPKASDAFGWPPTEAWISDNWHEEGATVFAALIREHSDGRTAGFYCTVDLEEDGLTHFQSFAVPLSDHARGVIAEAADDLTLVETDAASVAALVEEAQDLGVASTLRKEQLTLLRGLVSGLDPRDAEMDFITGSAEENKITESFMMPKKPWWKRIFGAS